MSEERQDPKQVDAFRALARDLTDAQSNQRFEEALRRLMSQKPKPASRRTDDAEESARIDVSLSKA